ncbi:TPA: portal protein, partial [Escherichia coli]
FPLVPFWGYRKDKTGEPYGLISRAIPAQDEVNFRRIKLTWLLQAKRVIMDEDATQLSDSDLMEQIERPDGIIKLNPARKNQKSVADVFRVEQDFQVASQQFQVMQESEKLIQDTMGVYSAFLGQDSGATSGVAISNL